MKPTIKLHSFINKAAGNQKIPAASFYAFFKAEIILLRVEFTHSWDFKKRKKGRKTAPQLRKIGEYLRYLAILLKLR
jgi:hypothetical protein